MLTHGGDTPNDPSVVMYEAGEKMLSMTTS